MFVKPHSYFAVPWHMDLVFLVDKHSHHSQVTGHLLISTRPVSHALYIQIQVGKNQVQQLAYSDLRIHIATLCTDLLKVYEWSQPPEDLT